MGRRPGRSRLSAAGNGTGRHPPQLAVIGAPNGTRDNDSSCDGRPGDASMSTAVGPVRRSNGKRRAVRSRSGRSLGLARRRREQSCPLNSAVANAPARLDQWARGPNPVGRARCGRATSGRPNRLVANGIRPAAGRPYRIGGRFGGAAAGSGQQRTVGDPPRPHPECGSGRQPGRSGLGIRSRLGGDLHRFDGRARG